MLGPQDLSSPVWEFYVPSLDRRKSVPSKKVLAIAFRETREEDDF